MAKRFGLGQLLEIDMPGSRPGVIPTKAWKNAVIGSPWVQGETLLTAIGQGFVLATPMQLATMVARIANGGKAITPYIARDVITDDRLSGRANKAHADIGVNIIHIKIIFIRINRNS